jgi:hypothetical protein
VNSRVNRTRFGFSSYIEQSLLNLRDRFDVREVRFDPYQMLAVAQRRVFMRFGASVVHRENLAALAALTQEVYDACGPRRCARWLRTPIRALEGESPRQSISSGQLRRVSDLVEGSRAGLSL